MQGVNERLLGDALIRIQTVPKYHLLHRIQRKNKGSVEQTRPIGLKRAASMYDHNDNLRNTSVWCCAYSLR